MRRGEAAFAAIVVIAVCGCSGSSVATTVPNRDGGCVAENAARTAVQLHQSRSALRITWTSLPPIPVGHAANVVGVELGDNKYSVAFQWFENGQAVATLWDISSPAQTQRKLEARSHFTGRRASVTVKLAMMPKLGRTFRWNASILPRERPDFAWCPSNGHKLRFPPPARPSTALGINHEDTVASGESGGVSWTVFRGLGGQHGKDMCYRYETTPPVPPARESDGLRIFPGFCAPLSVPAQQLPNNALLAKIVPLPSGGTLIYGLVRGNVAQLGLVYSDGTSGTNAVTDHSIALAVLAGKTLDKITGTFNRVAVECTPMVAGEAPPADGRAPDGEYGCSVAASDFPVPDTSPAANPSVHG